MNRRSIIAWLVAAPLVLCVPETALLQPHAERRFRPASRSAPFSSIDVEVALALTEGQARALRAREARDPFDGMVGEFYITGSSPVEIPDHLPGSITAFDTVVGAAGAEGIVHVGGFRRGRFVWAVRTNGSVDLAIEAAEFIAGVDLPDEVRVRLAPSLLTNLLPGVDAFSVKVEIDPR